MRIDKKKNRHQNDRFSKTENKLKRSNSCDSQDHVYQPYDQGNREHQQRQYRHNMSYDSHDGKNYRSQSGDQQLNRYALQYERRLLEELLQKNKKQNKYLNGQPQPRQNEFEMEEERIRDRKSLNFTPFEKNERRNGSLQAKEQIMQPFQGRLEQKNPFHYESSRQNGQKKKEVNLQYDNKIPFQKDIHHVEDQKVGIYIVDELGTQFIKEESECGQYIKERIFVDDHQTSRAIHSCKVVFRLNLTNQKGKNKKQWQEEQETNKCKRAQIIQVIKYPDLDTLVGYFGEFSRFAEKPEIDFGIKNKSFNYQNKELFYFYPLDTRYPRMLLKLKNASQAYPAGELFKKYFRVKFLEWPEEYSEYGPLIEILEPLGYLYDEVSDIQAFFQSYNCNFEQIQQEEFYIQKSLESYKRLLKNESDYLLYENKKIFTVDQIGAFAFDDAISIEKITVQDFIDQRQRHYQIYKNNLSQNSNDSKINNLKGLENLSEIDNKEQTYYKIGVHITDFSQCIDKGTTFFQGLESRKQSIYIEIAEGKNMVKHMLDRDLIEQFSMKKGELRLTKSIFFCIQIDQLGQLKIEWDSLTIENTKLIVKENYFYNEFDQLCDINKEIYTLYKQEYDQNQKIQSQQLNSQNEKKLVISQEEASVLLLTSAHLFKLREEQGQKAFQNEKSNKRYISSKMIEEFMVLYNQSISRYLLILQHINSKQSDIKNNSNFLSVQLEKNISQIKKNKTLLTQSLQNLQKKYQQAKNNLQYFEILESQQIQNQDLKDCQANTSPQLNFKETEYLQSKCQQYLTEDQDYMKSYIRNNQENQVIYKVENESLVNSSNLLEIITESGENEEEEELVNPFTIKKDYLVQKVEEIKNQIQKLQKEMDQMLQQQSTVGQNNKIKASYYKQVEYFHNQCLQVGFNQFKYATLKQFQSSLNTLRNENNLNPAAKKYLLYKKQHIQNDLLQYFQLCQKEANQVQRLFLQVQQAKDQIAQLLKDQLVTQESINMIKIQEMQFNLQKQQDSKKSILKDSQVSLSIQDEKGKFIYENGQTSPQKQELHQQQTNKKKSQVQSNKSEKHLQQKDIIQQDINLYQSEMNCLSEQIQELDLQIISLKEEFNKQELEFKIRVENGAYKLFNLLDIAPESDKYVSATSPIRKFNDIVVQKFLNVFIQDRSSLEFQKEYSYILFQKQQNTKQKNEMKKFKEKLDKLKSARNMLLKGYLEGKTIQKKETVLQINRFNKLSEPNSYIFFLPDELQQTRFVSDNRSQNFPKNFTIWEGMVVAYNHLPYNIYLASVSTKEGCNDTPIFLKSK